MHVKRVAAVTEEEHFMKTVNARVCISILKCTVIE